MGNEKTFFSKSSHNLKSIVVRSSACFDTENPRKDLIYATAIHVYIYIYKEEVLHESRDALLKLSRGEIARAYGVQRKCGITLDVSGKEGVGG